MFSGTASKALICLLIAFGAKRGALSQQSSGFAVLARFAFGGTSAQSLQAYPLSSLRLRARSFWMMALICSKIALIMACGF
jgi:hypothetical protein